MEDNIELYNNEKSLQKKKEWKFKSQEIPIWYDTIEECTK